MKLPVLKKAAILFAILVLPSLAYLMLRTGKNQYKKLAVFGPKDIAMVDGNGLHRGDTIYHKISDFNFISQEGKPFGLKDLDGKFFVANFFFTSCQSICPKMTSYLYRVQERFPAMRDLRIVSFSVDPKNDSVPALRAYAKSHLVNPVKWKLLTGEKQQLYDLARNSFFAITEESDGGPDAFIHSDRVLLIDKDRRIRGIYDGTDELEMTRLADEIAVLSVEYKSQGK